MTSILAGDFSIQQAAVSSLLRWSDARDTELRARFAAVAAAQQRGYDAGFEAGRRAALEALAEEKRQLVAELAGLPSRPTFAEHERIRWHSCCVLCRRAGHRRGCPDCRADTRVTFADPMPGDYEGGPVAWMPGWVPGSGSPPEGWERAS